MGFLKCSAAGSIAVDVCGFVWSWNCCEPALLDTNPRNSQLVLLKPLHVSAQQSMAQGAFKDETRWDRLFAGDSLFSGSATIVITPASDVSSEIAFMPELQCVEDPLGQQDIATEDAAEEAGPRVRVTSNVLLASKSEIAACQKNRLSIMRTNNILRN